ncbi:MAG TPA: glycosyltransferase family 2 protein [Elusimicrobiota bacterium]|nr:glycosyltransferase family 2 protein [Elusimicrobiota bacterium]
MRLISSGLSPEDMRRISRGLKRGHTALVPDDAAALCDRVTAAIAELSCDAVIFMDGGASRAALDIVRSRTRLPAALAIFPDDYPAAWPRPSCSPDHLWCFSDETPVLGTDGLLPRRFHWSPRPENGWMRRRLNELLSRRSAAEPVEQANHKTELASLIIPCWNALPYLKECLKSVEKWTREPYEIIFVDNGSKAPTRRFLEKWRRRRSGKVRLIRNAVNLGFAKAVNQGMKAANGRYLIWLNTDVVVMPHWLDRIVDCAHRAPWIGAVGPMSNEWPRWSSGSAAFSLERATRLAGALGLQNAGRAFAANLLQGFCLLLKREAFERVGFLDERFGQAYYEDYDYCLRLRQAGYELAVAEDAFVQHHYHKSFEDASKRGRQSQINRQVWIEKWCRRSLSFLDMLNEQDVDSKPAEFLRRTSNQCIQEIDGGVLRGKRP